MSANYRILRKRLEGLLFSPDVDIIMEWVEELFSTESTKIDYVKFTDKLFNKKYNDELIFVDYPVSPKVRIDIDRFIKFNQLIEKDYKDYLKWLVEMVPIIKNRPITVYDMYDQRLLNRYRKNLTTDTETINERKKISNKRILKV